MQWYQILKSMHYVRKWWEINLFHYIELQLLYTQYLNQEDDCKLRNEFLICSHIIPHANTHARHYCICIQSKRINKLLTYYCQNIAKRSGFWIKWIASNIHRILHIHLKLSMFARTKVCKMKVCSVQINTRSKNVRWITLQFVKLDSIAIYLTKLVENCLAH